MKIYLVGYPSGLGGAGTEVWHTVRLWRQAGWEVCLLPMGKPPAEWVLETNKIGCTTQVVDENHLHEVPGLPGSTVVGFCNHKFINLLPKLHKIDCHTIWVNCMTFLFGFEHSTYENDYLPSAFVFQSRFQRDMLERQLEQYGYTPSMGHLIHGAFDLSEFSFRPRPHSMDTTFIIGRHARPATDKWSSNTWPIYNRLQYRNRYALMMGVDDSIINKIGPAPEWGKYLKPQTLPVANYLKMLHCLMPINGGARENWPRAGLEAMASGVPIIAQNQWGWQDMIQNEKTGFLANTDDEFGYYATMLAYNEDKRIEITTAARQWLERDSEPQRFIEGWAKACQF